MAKAKTGGRQTPLHKQPEKGRRKGRPSKYKPEYCQLVLDMGAEGETILGMSVRIGVHRDTLYEWAEVHPEFSDALTRGLAAAEYWYEKLAKEHLVEHHEKGGAKTIVNHALFKLVTANRFGWSDKQEVKTEGNLTINIAKDGEGLK